MANENDGMLNVHSDIDSQNSSEDFQDSQNYQTLKDFKSFNLRNYLVRGIENLGFSTPSPIQEQSIPIILQGHDLIAQAQTGTGKTAAFAIPILNILERKNDDIEALIITPTRELAMQISDEFLKLGRFARIRTICMYGGQSIKRQLELLKTNKPKIMIATPGRLLDHLKNERIPNFMPRIVVLDESDEMLDMGFLDDVESIFKFLPTSKQTLLFSATMPEAIKDLALRILNEPKFVKITPINITNQDIEQKYYIINENERDQAILKLLEIYNPQKSIIFTRTKKEADSLAQTLRDASFKAAALQGDMEQFERRAVMKDFRDNNLEILVATDVASRGLDISDVTHVFNYHIPLNPEKYVHRIGRTGRAGKKGVAVTLATPLEFKELQKIMQSTKATLELCEIGASDVETNAVLAKIANVEVTQNALSAVEDLKSQMPSEQLLLKLLSAFIATQFKGIGLSKEEIDRLQYLGELDEKDERKSSSKGGKKSHQSAAKNAKGKKEKPKKSKKFVADDDFSDFTDGIWG